MTSPHDPLKNSHERTATGWTYIRKGRTMLRLIPLLCIIGLFLSSCVAPQSVKLGDEAMQQQEYMRAVQQYEKALAETTDSYTKQQIIDKLAPAKRALVDAYLGKAREARSRDQKGAVAAIDHAIGILDEVSKYDDKVRRIARQRDIYAREKQGIINRISVFSGQSLEYIRVFRFEEALAEIEKGLTADSGNKVLQKSRNTLTQMIAHYQTFLGSIKRGNLQSATSAYNKMAKISPAELNFDSLPNRMEVVNLIEQESKKLQAQGKWWQAYIYLTQWDIPQLQQYVSIAQDSGAAYYHDQALGAMNSGQHHKGFLLIERAISLNDRNLGIFNLSRELGDLVNKSMQSNIAIASFDAPTNDPDAGKQFSDSLISYLYEVLPYGINILERDKIDYVLKEKTDGEQQLAQMLGVDLMVTGTVSLFRVDKVVDERTATVKVKSGEKVVSNPEYGQFIQTHGSNKINWPANPPPTTMTQSNFQLVKYNKGTAEMKGFAKVSVRIFDTKKGAIAFVKDYDANVNYSSNFQDELAEAGIEYIPMKLPTDTEAKEEMRKEIVHQIGKVVQSSFENREARFLNLANFYLERRQNNLAFIPLAEGYLYCTKAGLSPDNPSFMEIKRLINMILE